MSLLIKNQLPDSFDINRYKTVNPLQYRRMKLAAAGLRGKTVFHINSTATGGGVAELLQSQILAERALGLHSHWFSIQAKPAFFRVTKKIHNLLQGQSGLLSKSETATYLKTNQELAAPFTALVKKFRPDLIIIHDPQPLPLIQNVPHSTPAILRLHIDIPSLSPTLKFLRPFIENYTGLILSSKEYQRNFTWFNGTTRIIMPAIDPLTEKNQPLKPETAAAILQNHNINTQKPLVVQVSRFDKWKDPLGVIRAYYQAKNSIPDLQLALAGIFAAQDDPEAQGIFAAVKKHAKGDRDIHLFSRLEEFSGISPDTFISALYTGAWAVIQKSLREGFGLTMTEGMWKGKPVIAGDTAGARLQIKDGRNGIIVKSVEETARAIVWSINHPKAAAKMGARAKASVKNKFLSPRYLTEHLRLYSGLARKRKA